MLVILVMLVNETKSQKYNIFAANFLTNNNISTKLFSEA